MLEQILITIATAATPLLIAAIGELVVERSGVLNLGVEGMMVMGAVTGFAVAFVTYSATGWLPESWAWIMPKASPWIGLVAATVVGALFSLLFAFLSLTLVTNQVATGLALTLLGLGLSGMLGEAFTGLPGVKLPTLFIPGLSEMPYVGKLIFGQDPVFYLSIALTAGVAWFLFKTRAGLTLRSVGDNHGSAHALGIDVIKIRYLAVMFGGACAGLAGGYLSLRYTPQWIENMTAGRGWIALALVVFASWRPWRVIAGAYLFGAVSIGQLHLQAIGFTGDTSWLVWFFSELWLPWLGQAFAFVIDFLTSSQGLSSLPYLATIVVLVLISRNRRLTMVNTPASLGRPFVPDR